MTFPTGRCSLVLEPLFNFSMQGIGYILMNAANNQLRTDLILAGIVIYAILGIGVDLLVRGLERLLLPWRRSAVIK